MLKDKRTWIIAAYLFTALYILPMFPHGGSANEMTRWATAASLIEKGSFEIAWTEPLIGPNVDTAKVGDHIYSNKAPGPAIISAPIYAITRLFVGPPDASNIRVSWFVMRFAISTLPLLLLAFWMYRRGADELALTALLFATPLFVYSLLYFSHVLVAVAVYAAFRLCFDADKGAAKQLAAAGFLSGLAVISEFPAVLAVVVFAIGLILKSKSDRMRPLAFFILGGLPFAAFLLVYNNALFGSPFSMSYQYESFAEWAEVAKKGFLGISIPTPANAFLLLLSPSRGLLFTAPILILPLVVFARRFDRANVRSMVRLAAIVVCFLIICGHGAAHGGWAFGPRYLVFIIPFLLDPFFEGEVEFSPTVTGALLAASVLLSVIPALTFPFAPPEFTFPHNDFWMSLIRGEGWAVPNLANLFGIGSNLWNLLPVFLCLSVVTYAVAGGSKAPQKLAIGFAIGLLVVGIYTLIPGVGEGEDIAFRRAAIAERFFRPAGRLEKFPADPGAGLSLRSMQNAVADARGYAPDDFPYLPKQPLLPGPTAVSKAAVQLQKQQKIKEAEEMLASGEGRFPFARCELSTNLAVIYFTTNRKEQALTKLESVQSLVNPTSSPDCLRSQFLLGSLYNELGRPADSSASLQRFLANSAGSTDPGILNFRKQAAGK